VFPRGFGYRVTQSGGTEPLILLGVADERAGGKNERFDHDGIGPWGHLGVRNGIALLFPSARSTAVPLIEAQRRNRDHSGHSRGE
jgi:hypothetical protein